MNTVHKFYLHNTPVLYIENKKKEIENKKKEIEKKKRSEKRKKELCDTFMF